MLKITVMEKGGFEQVARELPDALREGIKQVILMWHGKFLPRHFRQDATSRYHYGPRTMRYMIRKARAKHHQLPLVWSGTMREMLLRRIEIKTMKSRAEGSGRLKGPRYLYMRETAFKKHALGQEVLITTAEENQALASLADWVATDLLKNLKETEYRTLT